MLTKVNLISTTESLVVTEATKFHSYRCKILVSTTKLFFQYNRTAGMCSHRIIRRYLYVRRTDRGKRRPRLLPVRSPNRIRIDPKRLGPEAKRRSNFTTIATGRSVRPENKRLADLDGAASRTHSDFRPRKERSTYGLPAASGRLVRPAMAYLGF